MPPSRRARTERSTPVVRVREPIAKASGARRGGVLVTWVVHQDPQGPPRRPTATSGPWSGADCTPRLCRGWPGARLAAPCTFPPPRATPTTPSTGAAAPPESGCRWSRSASGTTSAASIPLENARAILLRAFDLGMTHFDLANNYGPPYGSAEETFGRILREDLAAHRDELIISHQGRLRHVARPLRRLGLAQVPARLPRPVAAADGARLRRHLLPPPPRPRDAAGGDHGRAGPDRPQRQGALRRHSPTTRRPRRRGPSGCCASSARPA